METDEYPSAVMRQSCTWDCLNGLVRYPGPVFSSCAASPRFPMAVIMIRIVSLRSGSVLMISPTVSPSISGRCVYRIAIRKTLCGPGEMIDEIVTERGIAVNPNRQDLLEAVKGSPLPIRSIQELKKMAEGICGKPQDIDFDEKVVAVVKWVDGTVLDAVRMIAEF